MKQNPLIGKVITALEISEDKEALRFVLDDGECVVACDADCCSHTWIEHVELPALGFPARVVAVEDLDLETSEANDGELQFYGCKVTTDRGEIVIDYRNESNGYYGGSLTWPGEHHYGGVFQQNISNQQWRPVA